MGRKEDKLAEDKNTPPEKLDELARNGGTGTLIRIVSNPSTRIDTLLFLSENTTDAIISLGLIENPKTPDTVLLKYIKRVDMPEHVRFKSVNLIPKQHLQGLIDLFNQEITSSRKQAIPLGLLGEVLWRLGDEAGAINACEQALSKKSIFSPVGCPHYVLASIHATHGNIDDALKEISKAIDGNELDSYAFIAMQDPVFQTMTDKIKKRFMRKILVGF